MHARHADAPGVGKYVSSAQAVQALAWGMLEYCPTEQFEHIVENGRPENCPGWQGKHVRALSTAGV